MFFGLAGPDPKEVFQSSHGGELILLVSEGNLIQGTKQVPKGSDALDILVKVGDDLQALLNQLGELAHHNDLELATFHF